MPAAAFLAVYFVWNLGTMKDLRQLAEEIFGDNLVKARVIGSLVNPIKPFTTKSDVDVEVWAKDARLASRQLSGFERSHPRRLYINAHKAHFLIRPAFPE